MPWAHVSVFTRPVCRVGFMLYVWLHVPIKIYLILSYLILWWRGRPIVTGLSSVVWSILLSDLATRTRNRRRLSRRTRDSCGWLNTWRMTNPFGELSKSHYYCFRLMFNGCNFRNHSTSLVCVSKSVPRKNLVRYFYKSDVIPVTEPTASRIRELNYCRIRGPCVIVSKRATVQLDFEKFWRKSNKLFWDEITEAVTTCIVDRRENKRLGITESRDKT